MDPFRADPKPSAACHALDVERGSAWPGPASATACAASLYLVVLGASLVADVAMRPLWIDEIFTVYQVQSRDFADWVASMQAGVNALPYLYFVVPWALDQMAPLTPLSLRLPSTLFAWLTLLLLHRRLARWFGQGPAFAACAGVLLLSPEFMRHAHDGRPYALYALVAVLLLNGWAAVAAGRIRGWAAAGLVGALALVLPSTHYVGLFYGAIPLAVFAVRCWRNAPGAVLRLASAQLIGYGLFAVLHWSPMQVFIDGRGAFDARYLARPLLADVFTAALGWVTLPATAGTILLALLVVALAAPACFGVRQFDARLHVNVCDCSLRQTLFTALAWLMVPPVLLLAAALGGERLTLPRYFLPSLIGAAVLGACALAAIDAQVRPAICLLRWTIGRPRDAVIVAVVASLVAAPLLVDLRDIVQGPPGGVAARLKPAHGIVDGAAPWVTPDPVVFFNVRYHRPDVRTLWLLRADERVAEATRRFLPHVQVVTLAELSRWPEFMLQIDRDSPHEVKGFEPAAWAVGQGFAVTAVADDRGRFGSTFALRRDRARTPP